MSKIGLTFSVYNNLPFTKKCLDSIQNCDGYDDINICVVNNGSSDGTLEFLELHKGEKFEVINYVDNHGCSVSWNAGLNYLKSIGCEYLVLTQNDVIVSKKVLNFCSDFLDKNENMSIVSPSVINRKFDYEGVLSQGEINEIAEIICEKYPQDIYQGFKFSFFMMRCSVFEKVQFDENYRTALYEDYDFCKSCILNEFLSCSSPCMGLHYHRYGATQVIVNNEYGPKNGRYYDQKWGSKKTEERIYQNKKKIGKKIKEIIKCPIISGVGVDYEAVLKGRSE